MTLEEMAKDNGYYENFRDLIEYRLEYDDDARSWYYEQHDSTYTDYRLMPLNDLFDEELEYIKNEALEDLESDFDFEAVWPSTLAEYDEEAVEQLRKVYRPEAFETEPVQDLVKEYLEDSLFNMIIDQLIDESNY